MTLVESEGSKGCLMAPLKTADARKFVAWEDANIPEDVLAANGWEREIHVTVLYGFEKETAEDIQSALEGYGPITFSLGKISKFQGDSDVIKVEVTSPDLEAMHEALKKLFSVKTNFPEYHPHLTLAYVKPGSADDLIGCSRFEGETYVIDTLVFSSPDSAEKTLIVLV